MGNRAAAAGLAAADPLRVPAPQGRLVRWPGFEQGCANQGGTVARPEFGLDGRKIDPEHPTVCVRCADAVDHIAEAAE